MAMKCLRVCVCVVAMLLSSVRVASAGEWDFLWWLEQLSGPGPFLGWRVTEPVLCYGVKADAQQDPFTLDTGTPTLYPAKLTCGRVARRLVWAKVGVRVGRATGDNNLQYGQFLSDDQKKVTVWDFGAVVDVSLRPYIDVGSGIGILRFSGKPIPGSDFGFSKIALEPIRVTVRPLAIGDRVSNDWREILELRYTSMLVPDGFDDDDFEALPDTFRPNTEFQSSVSLVFNFAPLIDRARRR